MSSRITLSESVQASCIWTPQTDKQQPPPPDHQEQQEQSVPFSIRVALVAAMFGIEACMSFENIYMMLLMQYLGVPVSLMSINGVINGFLSMALIPTVGAFSDRGKDPRKRKMFFLVQGMGVFLTGLFILLIASLVKLSDLEMILSSLENKHHNMTTGDPRVGTTSSLIGDENPGQPILMHFDNNISSENVSNSSSQWLFADNSDMVSRLLQTDSNQFYWYSTLSNAEKTNLNKGVYVTSTSAQGATFPGVYDYDEMPATAYMAIAGFTLLDLGYDASTPIMRAYIVEVLPHHQQTAILIMGSVAQAIAGFSFSILGFLDIQTVLGQAFGVDGTAAATIFFACVLMVVVCSTYASSVISGFYICRKHSVYNSRLTDRKYSISVDLDRHITKCEFTNQAQNQTLDIHRSPDDLVVSLSLATTAETSKGMPDYVTNSAVDSMTTPLLSEDFSQRSDYSSLDSSTSKSINILPTRSQASQCLPNNSKESNNYGHPKNSQHMVQSVERPAHNSGCVGVAPWLNRRLVVVALITFLGAGTLLSFGLYSANALTIGIYQGEPTALPGTEAKKRYEDGLKYAAIGNCILYVTFMLVSFNNKKIIETIGEKAQFVIFHVLSIGILIGFTVSKTEEMYFVTMAIMGPYRTCVSTIPFILANKYNRDEGNSEEPSSKGRVMSLIGFMMPLHYILLSVLMGPLISATQDVWIPIVYAVSSMSVALVVFLPLYVMKNT